MAAVLACMSLHWGVNARVVEMGTTIFAQGHVAECLLLLNTSVCCAALHHNSSQIV